MTAAVVEIDLKPYGDKVVARKREPAHRRTGSPVRRHSTVAGGERPVPITWTQRRLRLDAWDKLALQRRSAGQRWGSKGTWSRIDREILSQLLAVAAKMKGNVFPSLGQIAAWVGCSVRSVVGGLKRLKAAGFLTWDRRYVETDKKGLRGPQVEQTSNFYYMALPNAAAALIDLWRGKRAPREDEAAEADRQARAEFTERCRKADLEAMWKGRGGDPPSVLKALPKAPAVQAGAADQAATDSS
jgi:alkylated DNA nucleotide flippase Atl1